MFLCFIKKGFVKKEIKLVLQEMKGRMQILYSIFMSFTIFYLPGLIWTFVLSFVKAQMNLSTWIFILKDSYVPLNNCFWTKFINFAIIFKQKIHIITQFLSHVTQKTFNQLKFSSTVPLAYIFFQNQALIVKRT